MIGVLTISLGWLRSREDTHYPLNNRERFKGWSRAGDRGRRAGRRGLRRGADRPRPLQGDQRHARAYDGDVLLRELGPRLAACVGDHGLVARLGVALLIGRRTAGREELEQIRLSRMPWLDRYLLPAGRIELGPGLKREAPMNARGNAHEERAISSLLSTHSTRKHGSSHRRVPSVATTVMFGTAAWVKVNRWPLSSPGA
jgi:hypothetical protein